MANVIAGMLASYIVAIYLGSLVGVGMVVVDMVRGLG
jgi:hypothetical protein